MSGSRARAPLRVAAVACVLALAACAAQAPTHFHSLMPPEVAPRAASAASAAPLVVAIEPVRVPAQVDQPQWVVRLPDGSLAVLEQERWASALPDEFRAALLERLIVGHGAIDARTQPAPAAPPWRIALDVRRFDSVPGSEARIEGSWTIQGSRAGRPVAARCEWLLREPAPGGMVALAEAHRRAVARLADGLAIALDRAARGDPAACPRPDER
jgi:uncharacterized lipoprotein YmbA